MENDSGALDAFAVENFDQLADWLVTLGSHFSPAELHGALSGALSGGLRLADHDWAGFGLAVIGAESMVQGAEQVLGGLARGSLTALADADLAFALYLPDDDEPLTQRTEQLGHWCRGFLGGFAESQAKQQRLAERLPEAVEEVLRDLAAIAQASAAPESAQGYDTDTASAERAPDAWFDAMPGDEPAAMDATEAGERDYYEVMEYVRLAVISVVTEVGWVENTSSGDSDAGSERGTVH